MPRESRLPASTTYTAASGDDAPCRPPTPDSVASDKLRGADICTFATTGYSPSPPRPRDPRLWWSRPMHPNVCSMFARMPRYGPAPSGIRSGARMRATGQNDSSRHVLASFDSSSRRINEQSSGLLIRGFGVQVPGGAPVLSRHYMCLLLLFSGVVGPGWVLCGTGYMADQVRHGQRLEPRIRRSAVFGWRRRSGL
jgi:hypothetical protein